MSTQAPPEPAPEQAPDLRRRLQGNARSRMADPVFRWFVVACGASVLVVLAAMLIRTTQEAWPIFAKEGLGFFTGDQWTAQHPDHPRDQITGTYGALAFMYGTLITSVVAVVLALPLAVAVALYITQIAPRRLRNPLSYLVETLAAVPSIVYGLWGMLFFMPTVLFPVMRFLSDSFGWVPLFAGSPERPNYFVAGVILAIMILPIITAIIREVFSAIPTDEQHAAYGLGATRFEVVRKVLLPRAFPGIVGGTMLGLGRAIGETIAVAMVVGGSQRMGLSLFTAGDTMAAHIANTFQDATPNDVLGLLAIGVALFVFTMLVNVGARLMVWRIGRVTGDAAV